MIEIGVPKPCMGRGKGVFLQGQKESNWFMRIFTGIVMLATNLVTGAALGLIYVRLFVDVDMGFGGVADVLGGIMVGALLGLVVCALVVFLVRIRLQWVWIGVTAAIGGLTLVGLVLTAPKREASSEVILKDKSCPALAVRMKLGNESRWLNTNSVPIGFDHRSVHFLS